MQAHSSTPLWLAQYRTLFEGHEAALLHFWESLTEQADWPFSLDKQLQGFAQSYWCLLRELSVIQLPQGRMLQLQQRVRAALLRGHIDQAELLNQKLAAEVINSALKLPDWRQRRWLRYVSRVQASFGLLRVQVGDERTATENLIAAIEALPEGTEQRGLHSLYYNEVGYALYRIQDYTHAERFYAKALRLSQQQYGELHLDTALGLNNLGLLKTAQGCYEEAETLYLRALDTKRLLLGEHHLNYVSTASNLGSLYAAQWRLDDAQAWFLKTLDIRLHVLGEQHFDTQLSQYNLAWWHEQCQQGEKAGKLYQKILQARHTSLGPQHPDTVLAKLWVADNYQAQGHWIDAKLMYSKAKKALHEILEQSPVQHGVLQQRLKHAGKLETT